MAGIDFFSPPVVCMCVCVCPLFLFFLRYTLKKKGGVLAEREEIIGATGLSRTTRQRNITLWPSSSSDGVVSMGKENIRQTHDEDELDDDDSVGSDCRWRQPDGSWKVRKKKERKKKNAEYL